MAALANRYMLCYIGALQEFTVYEKELRIKFKESAIPCHVNGAIIYSDLDTGHVAGN